MLIQINPERSEELKQFFKDHKYQIVRSTEKEIFRAKKSNILIRQFQDGRVLISSWIERSEYSALMRLLTKISKK